MCKFIFVVLHGLVCSHSLLYSLYVQLLLKVSDAYCSLLSVGCAVVSRGKFRMSVNDDLVKSTHRESRETPPSMSEASFCDLLSLPGLGESDSQGSHSMNRHLMHKSTNGSPD